MYLSDFFKRITRRANIPVLVYLVLNVAVITAVFTWLLGPGNGLQAFLWGMVLYALSLAVALSPAGEWILRVLNGCREIRRKDQLEFIMPLFQEVYRRARKADPTIPDDVRIFLSNDETPNAFATGRRTICVTKGLLRLSPAEIKAALAHEFGHLAHKDTDLVLVISVGNLLVMGIVLCVRLVIEFAHLFAAIVSFILSFTGLEGFLTYITEHLYHLLIAACVNGIVWLWTSLGTLLVMKSSRENEYEADAFSFRLGYGDALCLLLDTIDNSGSRGFFAALVSSHPSSDLRIAALQKMGAAYGGLAGRRR